MQLICIPKFCKEKWFIFLSICLLFYACKNDRYKIKSGTISHPSKEFVPNYNLSDKLSEPPTRGSVLSILSDQNWEFLNTIGRKTGTLNEMYSHIADVELDDKDNIFILDNSIMVIRVFDEEGSLVMNHDLGKGQGPGDFNSPTDMEIIGDKLYVADFFSISEFNISGNSITYTKKYSFNHTTDKFCFMNGKIFIRAVGMQPDSNKSHLVHVYDFESMDYEYSFGELYNTPNPRLSTDGLISCSAETNSVSYTFNYFQYIYNYKADGRFAWVKEVPNFNNIPIIEKIENGRSIGYNYGGNNIESSNAIN